MLLFQHGYAAHEHDQAGDEQRAGKSHRQLSGATASEVEIEVMTFKGYCERSGYRGTGVQGQRASVLSPDVFLSRTLWLLEYIVRHVIHTPGHSGHHHKHDFTTSNLCPTASDLR